MSKHLFQIAMKGALVAATLFALLGASCPGTTLDQSAQITASMIPAQATVLRGNGRDFVVSILPRGDFEGVVQLTAETGVEDVNCTPSSFTVFLEKGSTSPRMETIRVSAFATAPPGPITVVIRAQGNKVCSAVAVVTDGSEPGLAFSAAPGTVFANSDFPSQDVTFTLTPGGSFSGNVTVSYEANGQIEVVPSTNPFTVNVPAGEPVTFTRKFRRFATHSEPIQMTFTAKNADETITRTANVTVNPSTG